MHVIQHHRCSVYNYSVLKLDMVFGFMFYLPEKNIEIESYLVLKLSCVGG